MAQAGLPTHFFARQAEMIAELEANGVDVISLAIGSPDLPPHPDVVETLAAAAQQGNAHGYQSHNGIRELRQAWGRLYGREFDVSLDTDKEVLPLLGSKEGIFHLIAAVVSPGEGVLVPDPGYVTYRRGTAFAGGEVVDLPLHPENGYVPDLDAIPVEAARRAKMLWLNYPNNPTTVTASLDFYAQVVAFAKAYDLLVCQDAAYSLVTFDGYQAPSILQVQGAKDVVVEFNSLSKSHNMAGWRCGVAVGNAEVLAKLLRLKTNADSGHFLPIMQAAVTALNLPHAWIEERNHIYRERRDLMIPALTKLGFKVEKSKASIYLWAKVPGEETSEKVAEGLLQDCGVAVAPGTVFGARGEGYLRFSLTQPLDRLEDAVKRLENWEG